MPDETRPNGRLSLPPRGIQPATREALLAGTPAPMGAMAVGQRRSLASVTLSPERLAAAKHSFNARRLDPETARRLLQGDVEPVAGDLVLARVAFVGQHAKLQTPTGRRTDLYVGDEIVVAYGDRYATSQWEARIPMGLGECHLAAAGGLASQVVQIHPRMNEPTVIQPIGLLADASGHRIGLARFGLPDPGPLAETPPVLVVVGTSMDSGKTTSGAAVVHGLKRAGLRVGAAKVTGTGAFGDLLKYEDAGACVALDFVDAGLPTTYRHSLAEIQRVVRTLIGALVERGVDAIVVEVADGLLQDETAQLLRSRTLQDLGAGILFAAQDAIAAVAGERRLLEQGHEVRAIAGILTSSPLHRAEARGNSQAPVYELEELMDPEIALGLLRASRLRPAL